ncbi:LOW QUALITY PROTEIN: hypothetical protein BRADI_5g13354v3 [Brachypodium distachyon]|uniref:Uncharacterized protein n=1 Tax=Brachypodium distachyon TaxID=15368 RepID=A0A2K2CH01_BRADI|nr:LOW QUALITY PROTEIN: hypothetical protein BRADI_5g13354v3 [Brachypodium distachyon]
MDSIAGEALLDPNRRQSRRWAQEGDAVRHFARGGYSSAAPRAAPWSGRGRGRGGVAAEEDRWGCGAGGAAARHLGAPVVALDRGEGAGRRGAGRGGAGRNRGGAGPWRRSQRRGRALERRGAAGGGGPGGRQRRHLMRSGLSRTDAGERRRGHQGGGGGVSRGGRTAVVGGGAVWPPESEPTPVRVSSEMAGTRQLAFLPLVGCFG